MLPMTVRHIPRGDRDQAGDPGFGRQEIVVTWIELFSTGVVPDVEHLTALIEDRDPAVRAAAVRMAEPWVARDDATIRAAAEALLGRRGDS